MPAVSQPCVARRLQLTKACRAPLQDAPYCGIIMQHPPVKQAGPSSLLHGHETPSPCDERCGLGFTALPKTLHDALTAPHTHTRCAGQGHGRPTKHKPEIILNRFNTRLGTRIGRLLASLYPQSPQFRGRQVATFHNQRDFIFFRCYNH